MEFKCSGCGACCRQAAKLGLPDRGDGGCAHLQEDNSCGIYESRPTICRVNEMYHHLPGIKENLSLKEWYVENTKSCHQLIDEQGIDSSYKIRIEEYD